ncbi:hypothetical protein A4X13_0g4880, partial [Tilletia indica]
SGPPLCLRPSGYVTREVDLPPSVTADEHVDDHASSPPFAQREQAGGPQLFLADRPQLRDPRNVSVPESARPLAHSTKRAGCTVVALSRHPDVGTGQAYRSHVPLSTQIRINDTGGPPVSSLLDTGASLSTIDAKLFHDLGGTPTGHPIKVNGVGMTETEGWATITFFLAAHDSHGREVLLECSHDFHILPNFLPGLCLGLDFIQHHAVSIDIRHNRALLGRYSFPVTEKLPAPYAKEAELCSRTAFHIPARTSAWIPIDSACLAPGVDYTIHPRFMHTADHRIQLAGPTAIGSHGLSHVLLTNVGTQAINLPRRTPIADASVAHLGETFVESAHSFTLDAPMAAGATMASMAAGDAWTAEGAATEDDEDGVDADVAAPLDLFEGTVDPNHDLARDAATTLVDEHFKVGVDEAGDPPPGIVDLLRRHREAFALDGRPGLIRGEEMTIPLKPDAPLRSEPPRRASPEKRAAMDSAIDQLLTWDVIEPSSSPISFPVLMVRQYNKWRFCVDYRQLNAITVADRYPLPTTDSVFHTLMGKSWFSSLDAIRGYHQMPVKPEDRWKTAFVCHRGLYQYKAVPFGLRNAPAGFQRLMDKILGALRWKEAVIYIDDTVVATETLEEHLRALDTLLSRATAAGLKFSPAKCTFAVPSLVLLGRKVSGAGVAVWDERAKAVHDLPRPRTLQDLYHALGLFGYYRIFIQGFAALAEPLTRMTRGWRYESVNGRTRLVNQKGETASASQTVLEWGPTQEESFKSLKRIISSAPVLAHPDPSRPYVLYVDASKFAFAAALHQVHAEAGPDLPVSRPKASLNTLEFAALPPDVAKERWSAWVRADPVFRSLFHRAQSSPTSEWMVQDGVLLRRTDGRIALPEAALGMVLRDAHDHRGHFGFTKTYLAVSRRFWRPRLLDNVRAWIRHCPPCLKTKLAPKVGELDISSDARLPFETTATDLVLGLPRSRSGCDAVLIILDIFSRMVLLEPCRSTIDSAGIASIISNRVLRLGFRPRRLVSDSEARMTGALMQKLAESLGAVLTPSSPHHQQANSVERFVQTLESVLQAMCQGDHAHWDKQVIPAVELAMNSSPNITTGERPFDLVFIDHPDAAHAVFDLDETVGAASFPERLAAANARMDEARNTIERERSRQKVRYDRRHAPLPELRVGDSVFVRLGSRPLPGVAVGKFDPEKAGPFQVREVLSPHRVRLSLPAGDGDDAIFNVEQLDVSPPGPDPFLAERTSAGPSVERIAGVPSPRPSAPVARPGSSPGPVVEDIEDLVLPSRARQPPRALRDFHVGVQAVVPFDMLRGPVYRPKHVEVDGGSAVLYERPVSFLSRLTSISEQRLVAPELEFSCLAWAFAKWCHLLEGAEITVVTDHAPLGPMLNAGSSQVYGPVITRCRALLLPHIHNFTFIHRPGAIHKNVDSLSRLTPPS